MDQLRFQDPLWLLTWLPIIGASLWAVRRHRQSAILYSSVSLLKTLPVTWRLRAKRLLPWIWLAGLLLIATALARPQWGRREFRVQTEGIAIQMCIDRSGSMQAMDFELDGRRVNRLSAVKRVFRNFVGGGDQLPGRPNDLLGLIVFGGFAESKAPLTLDHGALLEVLRGVEIPKEITDDRGRVLNQQYLREEMATAIGDAVALAVDRLKDADAKSRVIILLSDGENTAGAISPEEAAKVAKTYGIRIYTIGVGSTGTAPFPTIDFFGREVLRAQVVTLDEPTLRMLADTTGGKYFNAKNTQALEHVYAEIDQLERTKTEGRLYTEYLELYRWLLIPGLSLVVLTIVLSTTWFRALP